ncbi:MAG: family 2 glycosyl transferase [Bacteroidota bacterium]|jgi:glycosyltransferase involved in cell wall biosynthesis|nr:family 2 glycosyl transferase [Bacteroidota bacterium]
MISDAALTLTRKTNIPDAKFSILIPTWNNLEYLKLCVDSIRKNSTFKHQIILHINEGVDGSHDWVKQQADIDYSYSKKNIGICYALNHCRNLVATDYVMYMNDDMYVCPGWDGALLDQIKSIGHNYFFLSSTCIEPDSGNNCMISKNYGTDIKSFREEELLTEYADLPMHDWQGSTWPPNVVHRDVWDLVGGYSIEFSPGMYSDPDFSMKLWNIGVRYYKGVSKSRAYHFGSKSVSRIKKNAGYYRFIGKWGITTSTLTTHYIKTGMKFQGTLPEVELSSSVKAKNFFKKLKALLAGK